MESTKEFQEETRRYFDRVAEDYDASYDGRFVRCMYREVVRRAASLPSASRQRRSGRPAPCSSAPAS